MNRKEVQLDHLLGDADKALIRNGGLLTGEEVRLRGDRIQAARSQRRRGVAAVALLLLALIGWRFLLPAKPQIANDFANANDGMNTVALLAEIDALRGEQTALKNKLAVLAAKQRLTKLNYEYRFNQKFPESPTEVSQRNENTWATLQLMSKWEARPITDTEREQLDLLARGFPNTVAGSVARDMLTTNFVSSVLYEISHEF